MSRKAKTEEFDTISSAFFQKSGVEKQKESKMAVPEGIAKVKSSNPAAKQLEKGATKA